MVILSLVNPWKFFVETKENVWLPRRIREFLHAGAALAGPVDPRDPGVENALADVAGHFLRSDQDALDLGVIDVRVVGPVRNPEAEARLGEEALGRLLQAALGQAEPQDAA